MSDNTDNKHPVDSATRECCGGIGDHAAECPGDVTRRHSTRAEAIAAIVAAIQAGGVVADARAEYDVDAIADRVLGDYDSGYAVIVDDEEFWQVIADNEQGQS